MIFPFYGYLTVYFASLLLIGIWVISEFLLLWIVLQWTFQYIPHWVQVYFSSWIRITGFLIHIMCPLPQCLAQNLACRKTLVDICFRLIWMIPAHNTSSSSWSPNGNTVQRQSELRHNCIWWEQRHLLNSRKVWEVFLLEDMIRSNINHHFLKTLLKQAENKI